MFHADRRRRFFLRRLENLRRDLARLAANRENLTDASLRFLRSCEDVVTMIGTRFAHNWVLYEGLPPEEAEEERSALCDQYQTAVFGFKGFASMVLSLAHGMSGDGVPRDLEPIAQSAVEAAVRHEREIDVILYSSHQPAYNYSIIKYASPITAWQRAFGGTATDNGRDYLFFSLPVTEQASTLMHAIVLGHEVGHFRDWEHEISRSLPDQGHRPYQNESSHTFEQARDIEFFDKVRLSWMQEFAADIIGTLLLGPANLLAFLELVSTLGGWALDGPTHPAPDRRVAVILDVLSRLGYDDVDDIRDIVAELPVDRTKVTARRGLISGIRTDVVDRAIWESVRESIPALIDSAVVAVGPDDLFTSARWADVEAAASLLAAGKTAGEHRSDAGTFVAQSRRVIVNAGWLVRMRRVEAFAKNLGDKDFDLLDAEYALDELVAKSLEISTFKRSEVVL